jgi:hypothetical protein
MYLDHLLLLAESEPPPLVMLENRYLHASGHHH